MKSGEMSAMEAAGRKAPKWLAYRNAVGLGAVAMGAAGTPGAEGAIIADAGTHNGASPSFDVVINPVQYLASNTFDIDADGIADVRLGTGGYNNAFADDAGSAGDIFTGTPYAYTYLEAFAEGQAIGDSSAVAVVNYGANQINSGTFTTGGYIGLKTSQGYFGWMDLLIEPGAVGGNARVTVRGWAYEDSGEAIDAGAVPEPSSLALLAAGAGCMAARRRRAVA